MQGGAVGDSPHPAPQMSLREGGKEGGREGGREGRKVGVKQSNICLLNLNINFHFLFQPKHCDTRPHVLPGSRSGPLVLFLSPVSPTGGGGLERGCTSPFVLCDRRRENGNCLVLVRSKVIYFQKLTEARGRGFIYFYSECHHSAVQGTWAHVGVNSCRLAWGRSLLPRRSAPGRGRGSSSGAQRCLGTWLGHLGEGPVSG